MELCELFTDVSKYSKTEIDELNRHDKASYGSDHAATRDDSTIKCAKFCISFLIVGCDGCCAIFRPL